VISPGETIAENSTAVNSAPVPAGVKIPSKTIAAARLPFGGDSGYQEIKINLTDDGFEPSVIAVQKNIPVNWIIDNDSLDEGNGLLIVPAYQALLELQDGENGIQFMPYRSFDFSTGDNIYYGYVKVVDDINNIDTARIKTEVENFETLIYPVSFFEDAAR
ncbi:MAG: heavy metal transporter, partial [Treponema sp.]|jgi:plastocyanin domain-containing protein|nr:heavy metal transporter [Treponema sp.]